MKNVKTAIKGISIMGFKVAKLRVKPKKPISKQSKIITWNKKIGKVFLPTACESGYHSSFERSGSKAVVIFCSVRMEIH